MINILDVSSESDITTVFLMLGSKCNFKCRHCVQLPYDEKNKYEKTDISENVDKYLRRIAGIRHSKQPKINIRFWGGEPLLYKETISNVINRFGDIFTYSMISNGSLLTTDWVDFLNKHKIAFTLSNDGPDTEMVRGVNVLEDENFLNLFKKIDTRMINVVFSKYSQDIYKVLEYFDEKQVGCYVNFEQLISCWDMPSDIYEYDLVAFKETCDKIVEQAYEDTLSGKYTREMQFVDLYKGVVIDYYKNGGKPEAVLIPRCGQIKHNMNIDLDGNVFVCHNSDDKIGTVDDDYYELLNKYIEHTKPKLDRCEQCPYFQVCHGGCPLQIDNEGRSRICEFRKLLIDMAIDYIKKFGESNILEEVEILEV